MMMMIMIIIIIRTQSPHCTTNCVQQAWLIWTRHNCVQITRNTSGIYYIRADHNNDKNSYSGETMPDTWCDGKNSRTSWSSISLLSMDGKAHLTCNLYFSMAANTIVEADLCLRNTLLQQRPWAVTTKTTVKLCTWPVLHGNLCSSFFSFAVVFDVCLRFFFAVLLFWMSVILFLEGGVYLFCFDSLFFFLFFCNTNIAGRHS